MAKAETGLRNVPVVRVLSGSQTLRASLRRLFQQQSAARRLKLLAGFTWLQATIQGLAALSGLLLVRVLEMRQFATYTIAASLLTTLNVLSDCGTGTGLNVIGGRVWRDRAALGRLVAGALQFRIRLACVAVPVGLTLGLFLFHKNQVPWSESIVLAITAVLGLTGTTIVNTYAVALRFHGKYLVVQRLELLAVVLRLALLSTLALVFINAILATLAATVSLSLQAFLIRRKAAAIMEPQASPDNATSRAIGQFISQQWFSTLFFAFQGQITIWIISLSSAPEKVAEVGALGRLAVLFAFLTSLLNGVATPALARCDSMPRLRRLAAFMFLAYALFAGGLLGVTLLFPAQVLWLLGGNYAGLAEELFLVVLTALTWGLTGVLYGLASARGWVWQAWLSPIFTIALQALLLSQLDLSEVRAVLEFGLLSSLPVLGWAMYVVTRGLAQNRTSIPVFRGVGSAYNCGSTPG